MHTNKQLLYSLERNPQDLIISASGIRGRVPEGLDPDNVALFVRAFAHITGDKLLIARDTRHTGSAFYHAAVAALLAHGKEVVDLGIIPTPTLKAAVTFYKADGALMITASHNPMDWNGIKLIDQDGAFFSEKRQKQWQESLEKVLNNSKRIKEAMEQKPWYSQVTQVPLLGTFLSALGIVTTESNCSYVSRKDFGFLASQNARPQHVESVLSLINNVEQIREQGYHVLMDAGGGAGGQILIDFLKELGCRIDSLDCETQAIKEFPREPEPTPDNLTVLDQKMKETQADLGLALDPDADRLIVGSPSYGVIHEEYTLPLALKGYFTMLDPAVFKKKPSLVFNLSTSTLCDRMSQDYNVRILRSAVGEANVVQKMQEEQAIFGGEGNGGVILPQIPSYGRDPLAATALILSAMAYFGYKNIDPLYVSLPKLWITKIKFEIPKRKTRFPFRELSQGLSLVLEPQERSNVDGLHLVFSDKSWLHLRLSNTEPVLRFICEGVSQERQEELTKQATELIHNFI